MQKTQVQPYLAKWKKNFLPETLESYFHPAATPLSWMDLPQANLLCFQAHLSNSGFHHRCCQPWLTMTTTELKMPFSTTPLGGNKIRLKYNPRSAWYQLLKPALQFRSTPAHYREKQFFSVSFKKRSWSRENKTKKQNKKPIPRKRKTQNRHSSFPDIPKSYW